MQRIRLVHRIRALRDRKMRLRLYTGSPAAAFNMQAISAGVARPGAEVRVACCGIPSINVMRARNPPSSRLCLKGLLVRHLLHPTFSLKSPFNLYRRYQLEGVPVSSRVPPPILYADQGLQHFHRPLPLGSTYRISRESLIRGLRVSNDWLGSRVVKVPPNEKRGKVY